MRQSLVAYVFLARVAAGTLVALLPHAWTRAAERHVRFQAVLAAVLCGLAVAVGLSARDVPGGWEALALAGGLALVVNALYGTFRRGAARVALGLAALAAAGGAVATALLVAPSADAAGLVAVATAGLLAGTLVGATTDAMILGHFYLMIRGLPLEALRRAGRFTAAVLLARAAGLVLVLLLWDGAAEVLLGREALWTALRVTFGLLGPLALLWMVRDTVRLANTQAATGLLYVAVAFALMGELAATWLEVQTGIPA